MNQRKKELMELEQLRVHEAMEIKGVSRVTIFNHKKRGTFNWTKNNLIINDEVFKNWIPRERRKRIHSRR